jgi:hypothetical protein
MGRMGLDFELAGVHEGIYARNPGKYFRTERKLAIIMMAYSRSSSAD